jgi:hypothetical protein
VACDCQVLGLRTGDAKNLLEKFAAINPSYRWVSFLYLFVSLEYITCIED